MRAKIFICLLSTFTSFEIAVAQQTDKRYPLVPYPQHLTAVDGKFTITSKSIISVPSNGMFKKEAGLLNEMLGKGLGRKLITGSNSAGSIMLKYDASITAEEGYTLTITPKSVTLVAKYPAGMFHAIETIRQLLPAGIENAAQFTKLTLPAVSIRDQPVYAWRGMHLDVSRHFFSTEYLRKFIDLLALYKMNKLHLHLTDDQGWRIEIKKYPKLTSLGAWRTFNNQDSACMKLAVNNPDMAIDKLHIINRNGKTLYGGFYTQQQMRAVVAYAAARHIEIIPEIDMPGHMMAAINAYPYLTCNGDNSWGTLFTKPICPCNETTFEFAQNVFAEIMDIFPSKYIHIGGDEVDRTDWAKSDACKELMKREKIKDMAGIQSYFIKRMEGYFKSRGRQLIGWDEVLDGKISPDAVIMYWRTWVPGAPLKAVKNGNRVVMVQGNPLYFDGKYDKNSAANVYHFNPVPNGVTPAQAKLILGAQAAIWTEYVPSEKRADYQFMPRMTALAEMLWTNDVSKYDSYVTRNIAQFARLDRLNVNYRMPDLDGIMDSKVFVNADTVHIAPPLPTQVIRFTSDGTMPNATSNVLNNYVVNKPQVLNIAAFNQNGRRGDVYKITYKQQNYVKAVNAALQPGLAASYYPGNFNNISKIPASQSDSVFLVENVAVPAQVKAPSFAIRFNGYIDVPVTGIYSFFFTCDDAGVLKIDDQLTVDNDGMHAPVEKSGQAAMQKGLHPFQLNFIEGGGGYTLKLMYSVNGSAPAAIPQAWLKH